jgi:hypothetical protein
MNKNGFFLVIVLVVFSAFHLAAQNCRKIIDSSTPYIDWENPALKSIQPGDTVCLQAGNWDFVQLKNFHGTEQNPIVFINTGGAVVINTDHYFGIKIGHCSHVILTGNGDAQQAYGFQIQKVTRGAGMGIDDYSTDIEVAHVEISHTQLGGVYAKTDPTCENLGATREKFVMYNFSFHDNWVHDVPEEGLYIGNTHYTGLTLSGCDTTVKPHVLKGVFIYNNLVENTGWDGIQVSSADSNCTIHDNTVNYDSQAGHPGQMSGILIGGGSVCQTYNNKISNGKGDGIEVFGMGNFNIFNNLIVNAGKYYSSENMKHGIYVGKVVTTPQAVLGIYNNTIVSPKTFGIKIANDELKSIFVKNNLIVNPGLVLTGGDVSFINTDGINPVPVKTEKNYESYDIAPVRFINAEASNYDLQPSSPAIDYGVDLTAEGVTFDILNRSRPFHGLFDAGAYESHDPSVGIGFHKALDVELFKIYPNPAHTQVTLLVKVNRQQTVQVALIDMLGREIMHKEMECRPMQNTELHLPVRHIKNGTYEIVIFSKQGVSSRPLLIKN